MPKLHVKQSGVWKQVQRLYVRSGGAWKNVLSGTIVSGGIGQQFYPDSVGATSYTTNGIYSYTVPIGVSTLEVTYPTITGMVSTNISVTPLETLTV